MILHELLGTEDHPVYQELQISNGARQVKSRKYFDADVNLPAFLQAKNLKPFISNDLEVTSSRIDFRTLAGAKAFGFTAEVLPSICEVFIDAGERKRRPDKAQALIIAGMVWAYSRG